jgi:hypothetical protein
VLAGLRKDLERMGAKPRAAVKEKSGSTRDLVS